MRHNLLLGYALVWWFAVLDLQGQATFFEYRDYNTCNIAHGVYKRVLPVDRIVPCQSTEGSADARKPLEKQYRRSGMEHAT